MHDLPVSESELDRPKADSAVVSTGEGLTEFIAHEQRESLDMLGKSRDTRDLSHGGGMALSILAGGVAILAISQMVKSLDQVTSLVDVVKDLADGKSWAEAWGNRETFLNMMSPELEQSSPAMEGTATPVSPPVSTGQAVTEQALPSSPAASLAPSAPPSSQYGLTAKQMTRPTSETDTALRKASATGGVDYATLYALAGTESNFNANAKAGTSSAAGMFQFTEGTWKYMTTKLYPQYGYTAADRFDGEKSGVMAALYVKDIGKTLEKGTGKKPTIGDIYLGYFMGPGGAVQFIKAMDKNPQALSSEVFPKEAAANKNLFFNKDGTPMTLADTYAKLTGRISSYYAQAQQQEGGTQIAQATGKTTPVAASSVTTTGKVQSQPAVVAAATENVGKIQTATPQQQAVVASATPTKTMLPGNSTPKPSYTYTRDQNGQVVLIPT